VIPDEIVTDYHQPSIKAVAATCPGALHIRTGLHRAWGETTKAVERSHVPTRDRPWDSRGLKRTETGERFLEGFEAVRHVRVAGHLEPATWCLAERPMSASGRPLRSSIDWDTACVDGPERLHHPHSARNYFQPDFRPHPLYPALHDFPNSSQRGRVADGGDWL
jgi:hypothetical protein